MAAIPTGRASCRASKAVPKRRPMRRACALSPPAKAFRSAPALKNFSPWPVTTTAYTSMLRFNSPMRFSSCSRPAAVKVLADGLFRVSTATWPSILHSIKVDSLFKADGRVHASGRVAVLEPSTRNGLGLGVKLHRLLAIGTQIAELGAARSRKAEEGHGHRYGHVDPDLAHIDLALKFARDGSALREDTGAVAERIIVDEPDGLIQGVHADDDHHGPADLGGIDFHSRRHARENRRADEIAHLVARHLDAPAVQLELGAFLDAVLDKAEDSIFRVLGDHGPQIGAFFHARIDLEGLGLGDDIRYPFARLTHQYGDGGGHAALPRGTEGGADEGIERLLLAGVRHHDGVILR